MVFLIVMIHVWSCVVTNVPCDNNKKDYYYNKWKRSRLPRPSLCDIRICARYIYVCVTPNRHVYRSTYMYTCIHVAFEAKFVRYIYICMYDSQTGMYTGLHTCIHIYMWLLRPSLCEIYICIYNLQIGTYIDVHLCIHMYILRSRPNLCEIWRYTSCAWCVGLQIFDSLW